MNRRTFLTASAVTAAGAALGSARPAAAAVQSVPLRCGSPGLYVQQSFAHDPATGDIYTTQPTLHSILVCRLDSTGKLLDWQELAHAGHGGNVGLERDGDHVYLWGYWVKPVDGGPRFPYRWQWRGREYAQAIYSDDPTVQRMPNIDGGLIQDFSINTADDLVGINVVYDGREPTVRYRMRRLSDLKAGRDRLLHSLDLVDVHHRYGVQQGFAFDDRNLYAAYGGGRPGTPGFYTPRLVTVDWRTGAETPQTLSHLLPPNPVRAETEGVFRHPDGTLQVGVVLDEKPGYNAMLYTVPPSTAGWTPSGGRGGTLPTAGPMRVR